MEPAANSTGPTVVPAAECLSGTPGFDTPKQDVQPVLLSQPSRNSEFRISEGRGAPQGEPGLFFSARPDFGRPTIPRARGRQVPASQQR
jgi:hypothetical protein